MQTHQKTEPAERVSVCVRVTAVSMAVGFCQQCWEDIRGLQRRFQTLHLVCVSHEAGGPLTDGGNHELAELLVEDVWMIALKAC